MAELTTLCLQLGYAASPHWTSLYKDPATPSLGRPVSCSDEGGNGNVLSTELIVHHDGLNHIIPRREILLSISSVSLVPEDLLPFVTL